MAEIPKGTSSFVAAGPPLSSSPHIFVVTAGSNEKPLVKAVFAEGPALCPRIAAGNLPTITWNWGNWKEVIVRKLSAKDDRLVLKKTSGRFAAAAGRNTARPVSRYAHELLFTPTDLGGLLGPTESVLVPAQHPQLLATLRHILAPTGDGSRERYQLMVHLSVQGCDRPPAVELECFYYQRSQHEERRITEQIELTWDNDQAQAILADLTHQDTVTIRVSPRETPLACTYAVYGVDDSLPPYTKREEVGEGASEWTYTFRPPTVPVCDETTPETDVQASLSYHPEQYDKLMDSPLIGLVDDDEYIQRLLEYPSLLLDDLMDLSREIDRFCHVAKLLAPETDDPVAVYGAMPEAFRLLLTTPHLLELTQRRGLPDVEHGLSSLDIVFHADSEQSGDQGLTKTISRRGDAEIDYAMEVVSLRMPLAWLEEYRYERGWICPALELLARATSMDRFRRERIEGLRDELIPAQQSELHSATEEAISLTETALDKSALPSDVRKADEARRKLGGLLVDHLEKLLECRPDTDRWAPLREVLEDADAEKLAKVIQKLQALRSQDCGDVQFEPVRTSVQEPTCCLKLDAFWLGAEERQTAAAQESLRNSLTWCLQLIRTGGIPPWPINASESGSDVVDQLASEWESFLEQVRHCSPAAIRYVSEPQTDQLDTRMNVVRNELRSLPGHLEGRELGLSMLDSLMGGLSPLAAIVFPDEVRATALTEVGQWLNRLRSAAGRREAAEHVDRLHAVFDQTPANWPEAELAPLSEIQRLVDDESIWERALQDAESETLVSFGLDRFRESVPENLDDIAGALHTHVSKVVQAGAEERAVLVEQISQLQRIAEENRVAIPESNDAPDLSDTLDPPARLYVDQFRLLIEAIHSTQTHLRSLRTALETTRSAVLDAAEERVERLCERCRQDGPEEGNVAGEYFHKAIDDADYTALGRAFTNLVRLESILEKRSNLLYVDHDDRVRLATLVGFPESETSLWNDDDRRVIAKLRCLCEVTNSIHDALMDSQRLGDAESVLDELTDGPDALTEERVLSIRNEICDELVHKFRILRDENPELKGEIPVVENHEDLEEGLRWWRSWNGDQERAQ